MESFKIAVCATLVLGSISSGAAQQAIHPQIHSHSSQTGNSTAIHAPHTKGLPRSTVNGGQPLVDARKSATGRSELDRLEQRTASQRQAQWRHEVRSTGTPQHVVHSQAPNHGSTINFSYHAPRGQAGNSSAASGRRR